MWCEGSRVDAVGMRLFVDIVVQRILRECITQTSLDVQAMRSTGGDNVALADSIYDDWTINEDNKPELLTPLQEYSASLATVIKPCVCQYNCGMDIITWLLDVEDITSTEQSMLNTAMLHYYKYSVLAWWYEMRHAELSMRYKAKAEKALGEVIANIGLNKSRIVGHYF